MQSSRGYIEPFVYSSYQSRYKECIRMLNDLEKSLEKHLSVRSMANGQHRGDHPS